MTPDRFGEIEELFHRAKELAPAEQVAEARGMTVNQVHAIKMRRTKMIRQLIGELTHDSG